MTASSVEFFPCRVQLIGLPRSSTTAATNGAASTAPTSRSTGSLVRNHNGSNTNVQSSLTRPTPAKIQSVSRNLFGSPEPGEIDQLYQEETQRQRTYVLQRYNFNIEIGGKSNTANAKSTRANVIRQLPPLLDDELQQHEQRLQNEDYNLNRRITTNGSNEIPSSTTDCPETKETTTITSKLSATSLPIQLPISPSMSLQKANNLISGAKVIRNRPATTTIITTTTTTSTNANNHSAVVAVSTERYKPYNRQILLTDCYNIRKNLITYNDAEKVSTLKRDSMDEKRKWPADPQPQLVLDATTCDHNIEDSPCTTRTDLLLNRNANRPNEYDDCAKSHNSDTPSNPNNDNTINNNNNSNVNKNNQINANKSNITNDAITNRTTMMLKVSVSTRKADFCAVSKTANTPHTHQT